MMKYYSVMISVFAVMGAAFLGTSAFAADRTWDGDGGDSTWNTASNWSDDTKPVTGDRARFNSGSVPVTPILLGANQTVDSLYLSNGDTYTIGGDAYSLTLANGSIDASGNSGTMNLTLDGTVILGTNGTWNLAGGYGSKITIAGTLSDGGNGFGFTTDNNNNHSYVLTGSNTVSGDIVIRGQKFSIAGATGVVTDAALLLDSSMSYNWYSSELDIDNTTLNTNRFGENAALGSTGNGGLVRWFGDHVYTQSVGRLELQGGNLNMDRWNGTPTVDFGAYDRVLGSTLTLGSSADTQMGVVMSGESSNIGGFWQPWAIDNYYEPDLLKVDANGALSVVPQPGDYDILAASGHDPLKPALMNFASLTLTAGGEVPAVNFRYDAAPMTLDLGTNDLRIARGVLLFNVQDAQISSAGGKLVVGGDEIIICARVTGGDRRIAISAPIDADGTGSKALVVAGVSGLDALVLDGEDLIGTYDTISMNMEDDDILELGGPSDRAVTNVFSGRCVLIKSGTGTLTMSGTDSRRRSSAVVSNGTLRIASPDGILSTGTDKLTVKDGARLDVTAGTTWDGRFTVESGGTLGGGGTVSVYSGGRVLNTGIHFAPGQVDTVGTLTLSRDLDVPTNAVFDIKLGLNTNDLLSVEDNFSLPADGTDLYLNLSVLSDGPETVKGKTYIIAKWTGSDPTTTPVWHVVSESPDNIIADNAVVTVNTTDNQIEVSGLVAPPKGTMITVR